MGFYLPIQMASWLATLVVLAISAGMDVRDRRIPNELVAAVAAIGLAQGLISRPGALWLSVVFAAAAFLGLGILSHHRIIGGGDVKLLSAVTLLVPPARVGQLLIDVALAGGVLSLLYLAAHFSLRTRSASPSGAAQVAGPVSGLALALRKERVRIADGGPMPYALAIFGGVFVYAARELPPCYFALSC